MALSNYKFAEASVTGGLTVRGLSFIDISMLVRQFGDDLMRAFENVGGAGFDVKAILSDVLPKTPGLMSQVIACGCGEPDQIDSASRLPFAIQVEAIEKIGELTFATEGGAKKVFQMVISMLNGASGLMTDLTI